MLQLSVSGIAWPRCPHTRNVASVLQARFLHAEPLGVQLPARHLYLMERLEDKVAAVNNRIKAWRKWLTSVLAAAQRAEDKAAEDSATAQGLEVAPVGVPVQVGLPGALSCFLAKC